MKKFFTKEVVASVLFLAVVIFFFVSTTLSNLPFSPKKIETVYTEKLYNKEFFVEVWSLSRRLSTGNKATIIEDAEYGNIIRDTHGKLHFPAAHLDISYETGQVLEFSAFLNERDIPFVYIQAPNKKLEGYTVFPDGGENYANEDCDKLLEILKENNINTLDLRRSIIEDNLDRDSLFYNTDHHWTTKTAFWAYGEVTDYLNRIFGLDIDPDGFYRDLENYKVTSYPESYLGSLGRRVGSAIAGYDDYDFISPDFETDYTVYDGIVSLDNPMRQGDFREAIVKQSILDSTDKSANKHASYFEYDYGNLIIKNNKVNNGIKILLIKDSFSLPFAAFLSTCVSEIHMIDLRDSASPAPTEYAEKFDFDCVMVMYNPEVFDTVLFDFMK
ncbi:MAG: hypothetical protein IJO74_03690 [Clostridia bacterium]|nr:hypothetical protein [Clostridia bacterium]